jgi:Trm5-related predicted tRNA methylase
VASHAEELPGHLTKILHALDCEFRGARRITKLNNEPSSVERAVKIIEVELVRAFVLARMTQMFLPSFVKHILRRQFWKCRLTWTIEKSMADALVHHTVILQAKPEQVKAAMNLHTAKLKKVLEELKAKLEQNAQQRRVVASERDGP